MKKGTSNFVDKEKRVLISVAERIGSTLAQVAALGQVAKKTSRATPKPVRRRKPRNARTKLSSKAARRDLRAAHDKTRSVPRKK